MKIKLLTLLIFFVFAEPAFSLDLNLVFTTEEQTLDSGEMSEAITVQVQNSNGEAEKVLETNDVTFTSTSATGEFLNATGNSVSTTMAKNTSSRTFYYKDSAEGVHTLTVTIKGRESGEIFEATQKINIGDVEVSPDEDDDDETPPADIDTPSSSSASIKTKTKTANKNSNSAHGSTVSVSTIKEKTNFKTDAGRERIVSVNAPIEFTAQVSGAKVNRKEKYSWSFGDGGSGKGSATYHTYLFPGEYNVVLNVVSDGELAVSRTKVRVVDPKIQISDVKFGKGGYVEITNNTDQEVNIQNWTLKNDKKGFFIPTDTIINSKSSIKVPLAITEDKNGGKVVLEYPNKEIAAEYDSVSLSQNIAKKMMAEEIEGSILLLTEEAKKKKANINSVNNIANKKSVVPEVINSEKLPIVTTSTPTSTSDIFVESYKTRKETESLLALPKKVWERMVSIFK